MNASSASFPGTKSCSGSGMPWHRHPFLPLHGTASCGGADMVVVTPQSLQWLSLGQSISVGRDLGR